MQMVKVETVSTFCQQLSNNCMHIFCFLQFNIYTAFSVIHMHFVNVSSNGVTTIVGLKLIVKLNVSEYNSKINFEKLTYHLEAGLSFNIDI